MLYSTPEMLSQLRIAIQKDNFSDGAASLNVKVFSICAITEMIFVFQLSGIFQSPHTERELVMVWGDGEVTTWGSLQKATQWPDNDTSPNIQMGNRKHTSCSLGYCSKDDYEREWQYLEQNLIYLMQFQVWENCTYLFPFQTGKCAFSVSDAFQEDRVTLDGNDLTQESIHVLVWWKVVTSLYAINHSGRQSGEANISSSEWTF